MINMYQHFMKVNSILHLYNEEVILQVKHVFIFLSEDKQRPCAKIRLKVIIHDNINLEFFKNYII